MANTSNAWGSSTDNQQQNQDQNAPYSDPNKGGWGTVPTLDKQTNDWSNYLGGQTGQYQNVAKPTAPSLTDPGWQNQMNAYMGQVQGGQQQAARQYLNQAATMGVQRGGFAQAGVNNPQAALAQQAVGSLAGMYGQNFQGALGYAQNLANFQQQQYAQAQSQLANLWNLQGQNLGLQGSQLASQRGYDVSLRQLQDTATQRDWQAQQNAQQQALQKALQTQQIGAQEQMQQAGFGQTQQTQGWQSQEAQLQRALQQQMQQAQFGQTQQTQGWQAGQNTQQQGWQGGQNTQAQAAAMAQLQAQNQSALQRQQAQNAWQQQQTQNQWQHQLQWGGLTGAY